MGKRRNAPTSYTFFRKSFVPRFTPPSPVSTKTPHPRPPHPLRIGSSTRIMAHIGIIGSGIIGLSSAYACMRQGHQVTLIDRNPARRDGCSFGNAGMVVPSHFIPLAAPGMVALGLKWMWNPESPFYIKPRLNADLIRSEGTV